MREQAADVRSTGLEGLAASKSKKPLRELGAVLRGLAGLLQELEQAILNHDPTLDAPPRRVRKVVRFSSTSTR